MWAAIRALTWLELATLAAIAGWNLCTYAFVWMSVTPRLTFGRAMVMTQATTALALVALQGNAGGGRVTAASTWSSTASTAPARREPRAKDGGVPEASLVQKRPDTEPSA